MIVSNIFGGLGNQMFQYAVGRMLALKHGVPLRLDVEMFSHQTVHQGFELERIFSAPMVLATPSDMRNILGWQSSRLALRLLGRHELSFLRSRHLIVEPHFHYYQGIHNALSSSYLKGCWQSERYFFDISNTIRQDLAFRLPMSDQNRDVAQKIEAVNAVSLHVRRGDYVSNPGALSYHGVCPLEYYERAIRYIIERVTDPFFFVFSDDLDWVRNTLQMDYPVCYVDHNRGSESYNDMRLMSLCSHHVIANSSFSWWGAWLNDSNSKIVVAPKQWFAKALDVSDLLPDSWVRL